MKTENEDKITGLPENAYRELKKGEEYTPIMSPDKQYKEVTPWSVIWGLIMAVIFSAAAAYLGLKVGQVFEAAIPIAIIAVGLSTATKRKKRTGGKCHYPIYRGQQWCYCGGSHFYPSGIIYSTSQIRRRNIRSVFSGIFKLPVRRNTRYTFPHPIP